MNILVVDDKRSVRDSLSQMLTAKGYVVDTAVNGLDGFEKAQHGHYQLFIIDHLMPLMNGVVLTKNIKQLSQYTATPILFISTQAKEMVEKLSEYPLFSQVLTKPIKAEALCSAMTSLLPVIDSAALENIA